MFQFVQKNVKFISRVVFFVCGLDILVIVAFNCSGNPEANVITNWKIKSHEKFNNQS